MEIHRRSLGIAVLLAVAIGVPAGASGADDPASEQGGPRKPTSSRTHFAAGEDQVLGYWTEHRIANAIPMDSERERRRPRVEERSSVMRREGQTVEGIAVPDDGTGRVVKAAQSQPAADYPFPFGRRSIEKQLRRVSPYKTVGRIFFSRGGLNYSCSGASVVSRPRQVVFTAGHCLHGQVGSGSFAWSKNVVFVPGRRMGKKKSPYGIFPAKVLWAPEGWVFNQLDAYDIGAFSVGKNAKGKTLQKAVGALGFGYNLGRVQHWDIFGYPAASPFPGDQLITCASAFAVQDDMAGNGPDTNGVGCDMKSGSSGGPWILRLRRGNLLNGVTSYGYAAQPAALFGPYFDSAANNLRCAAATGNENATSC